MFNKRTPALAVALALILATVSTAFSQTTPDAPDLSGPLHVELINGRSYSGHPVSFDDGVLVLRSSLAGGVVERGFPQKQVKQLSFPGDDVIAEAIRSLNAKDYANALPLLEALWRQRAPFLVLLRPEIIELLAALPVAHLEVGDPYRAIALARNLLPHTDTEKAKELLHASILRGHHRLRLYKETKQLANEWIQRQDEFPTSALGWKVLAELALREENLEQVTWLALQPIALAGPDPMPYLENCYALAIHAFHLQENTTRAAQLYREMLDRGFTWPADEELAATGAFYHSSLNEATDSEPPQAGPDLDLRPPEKELNLPLQKVRKRLYDPAS